MRKTIFVLIAIIIVGIGLFILREGQDTRPRGLACASELSSLEDYSGIGVLHSNNVRVQLRDDDGNQVMSDDMEAGVTETGIQFTLLTYHESRVSPGDYTVDVVQTGRGVIDTFDLVLRRNQSPVLAILCE